METEIGSSDMVQLVELTAPCAGLSTRNYPSTNQGQSRECTTTFIWGYELEDHTESKHDGDENDEERAREPETNPVLLLRDWVIKLLGWGIRTSTRPNGPPTIMRVLLKIINLKQVNSS